MLLFSQKILEKLSFPDVVKATRCELFRFNVKRISRTIPGVYSELGHTSKIKLFAKIVTGFHPLTLFCKKLHHRCMTGFWIPLLRKHIFKYNSKNNNRYIPFRGYFIYCVRYPQAMTFFNILSMFLKHVYLYDNPYKAFSSLSQISHHPLYKTFSNPPHLIDFLYSLAHPSYSPFWESPVHPLKK